MKKSIILLASVACLQQAHAERLIIQYKSTAKINSLETAGTSLNTADMSNLRSASQANLQYRHPLGLANTHVIQLPDNLSPAETERIIARLQKTNNIASVSKDQKMYAAMLPNDDQFNALWDMQALTNLQFGADFQTAWNTYTGKGVTVAVIDSGVIPHADLGTLSIGSSQSTGQYISGGYDFISDCRSASTCPASTSEAQAIRQPQPGGFDQGTWVDSKDQASAIFAACAIRPSAWHGTHVAGTIAAIGNNNRGVIGGAYNAKILPVRAIGKCSTGSMSDIINGILWASNSHASIPNPHPANIINLSLGGFGGCSPALQQAIDKAVSKNTLVVVAAGNDHDDVSQYMPANCNNVIVVGASTKTGALASYSNFGTQITVLAPGGANQILEDNILSTGNSGTTTFTTNGDQYVYNVGTSMATPHVSAALALLIEKYPTLTLAQAKAALRNGATAFPATQSPDIACTEDTCGKGILNINASLSASLIDTTTPQPLANPTPQPSANQAQTSSSGGGGGSLPINGMLSLATLMLWLRRLATKTLPR